MSSSHYFLHRNKCVWREKNAHFWPRETILVFAAVIRTFSPLQMYFAVLHTKRVRACVCASVTLLPHSLLRKPCLDFLPRLIVCYARCCDEQPNARTKEKPTPISRTLWRIVHSGPWYTYMYHLFMRFFYVILAKHAAHAGCEYVCLRRAMNSSYGVAVTRDAIQVE